MVSLYDFKSFPIPGETTISEQDGRLSSLPISEINIAAFEHPLIASYPDINISRELCHYPSNASIFQDDGRINRNVLIPVNETLIKRCTRTFFESGLVAALNEASQESHSQSPGPLNQTLSLTSKYVLRFIAQLEHVKQWLYPHGNKEGMAQYLQTRDWGRSLIRVIRWHPNCFRLAVAACDDSIRIYSDDITVVPILKSNLQKGICSMAWRPYSSGELAVGCQNGVLVWTWDPNSQILRPLSQPIHLKHGTHFPVTSLDWSSNGNVLATASINDSDIRLWDVDRGQSTPLRRVGSPCALLNWSPDGCSMFTSTIGNVFRVWSTEKWTPERWTVPHGSIQSAEWSPCGGYLLFVTTDESLIYSLCFMDDILFTNSSTPKQALPVADLSRIDVGNRPVGGRPQSIAWDQTGQHLAVTFKDSDVVAIFLTSISRTKLSIAPGCFLVGLSAEIPTYICFKNCYKMKPETVLTIGWSSGRVQFFPFV